MPVAAMVLVPVPSAIIRMMFLGLRFASAVRATSGTTTTARAAISAGTMRPINETERIFMCQMLDGYGHTSIMLSHWETAMRPVHHSYVVRISLL